MWFDVHNVYAPGQVSRDSAIPNSGVRGTRARRHSTTIPPPRYKPSKVDDGTVSPDTRASPPIDRSHKEERKQKGPTGPGGYLSLYDKGCHNLLKLHLPLLW